MPKLLITAQCIEYAESVVLPLLKQLQRKYHSPVRAGLIGELLGLCRRQAYNYLRTLEIVGLARLEGKRWKAA